LSWSKTTHSSFGEASRREAFMYPQKTNARRGYRQRQAARRAKLRKELTTMAKDKVRNKKGQIQSGENYIQWKERPWWHYAISALGIIVLILAILWLGRNTKATPTVPTTPVTTTDTITDTITTNLIPLPTEGWKRGETKDLLPGQVVLGDIVISNPETQRLLDVYDNGTSDEGSVTFNMSSRNISVHAPWGAGCLVSNDVDLIVQGELDHGCGQDGGCNQVRVVIIEDDGISVKFYD